MKKKTLNLIFLPTVVNMELLFAMCLLSQLKWQQPPVTHRLGQAPLQVTMQARQVSQQLRPVPLKRGARRSHPPVAGHLIAH